MIEAGNREASAATATILGASDQARCASFARAISRVQENGLWVAEISKNRRGSEAAMAWRRRIRRHDALREFLRVSACRSQGNRRFRLRLCQRRRDSLWGWGRFRCERAISLAPENALGN
jgi:hypothetical protein